MLLSLPLQRILYHLHVGSLFNPPAAGRADTTSLLASSYSHRTSYIYRQYSIYYTLLELANSLHTWGLATNSLNWIVVRSTMVSIYSTKPATCTLALYVYLVLAQCSLVIHIAMVVWKTNPLSAA